MTNTRPTFRPTAASFSPVTLSPTLPSSVNDLSLLRKRSHDVEREIQVHSQSLCDIRYVRRAPALHVPEDRGPRLRLRPLLHEDDASFPEFVHVGLHGPLDELGPRAHPGASDELIAFLEQRSGEGQGKCRLAAPRSVHPT